MKNISTQTRSGEKGNALFLILIAVALFAALSYAVTQSGRGGGTIDKEQSLISASQITQYPAAVRTAVTRMVLTGTQVSAISFDPAEATEIGVFAAAGGGAVAQDPPANVGATAWRFKTAPTVAAGGFFITGVGTDANAAGRDVFAFLDGVTLAVCQNILRGLGLSTTPLVEAVAKDLTGANEGLPTQAGGTAATTDDAGANDYTFNQWGGVATDPQAFACVDSGGANYVYYHALVEQ